MKCKLDDWVTVNFNIPLYEHEWLEGKAWADECKDLYNFSLDYLINHSLLTIIDDRFECRKMITGFPENMICRHKKCEHVKSSYAQLIAYRAKVELNNYIINHNGRTYIVKYLRKHPEATRNELTKMIIRQVNTYGKYWDMNRMDIPLIATNKKEFIQHILKKECITIPFANIKIGIDKKDLKNIREFSKYQFAYGYFKMGRKNNVKVSLIFVIHREVDIDDSFITNQGYQRDMPEYTRDEEGFIILKRRSE